MKNFFIKEISKGVGAFLMYFGVIVGFIMVFAGAIGWGIFFMTIPFIGYYGWHLYLGYSNSQEVKKTPSVRKNSVLSSYETIDRTRKVTTKKSEGILGPEMSNGEKSYISTSDRACIIGPPGTGKTSFLISQIYDWIESGKSLVCLDIKPEIYDITRARLISKGYKCIVYNPTSPIDCYDFLQDLDTPELIGEFASSLIPSEEAENAVFNETARDLLDALINHVKSRKEAETIKPTLVDVYDFLAKYDNPTALFNDLKHSKSRQTKEIINSLSIVSSNERLLGSIFATFNSQLRFLRYENIRKSLNGGFSLSELNRDKVALFLQFEETTSKTTGHLFSVFVSHLMSYLINNHKKRNAVFCLLDEIGNAGLIHDLTGKLNTIRSRNMPTWMYWQNTEQMQKYGSKADEGVNIILGACDFQMCFRLNDNNTAKWFSERVGTHLVENTSYNVTLDPDINLSKGNNRDLQREEIIYQHELQQLSDNEVLAIYKGIAWRGIARPYWKNS